MLEFDLKLANAYFSGKKHSGWILYLINNVFLQGAYMKELLEYAAGT
jgi:hypothetical protein